MDTVSPAKRSEIMRRVKSTNTSIEIKLRKALWRRGLRGWRVHLKSVIGKPDIVFGNRKVAIFVDGCFWHGCPVCNRTPKSGNTYWENKIARNKARDIKYNEILVNDGWTLIRLWEHEVVGDSDCCVSKILEVIKGKLSNTP